MQRLAVALAFWFSLSTSLLAETRKFPYEAVVRADNVTVRCGQGKNYYATSRMEKGAVLTVHRHDPGGWYMVSPPAGSFSWIAAEQVVVDAPGMGRVTLPEDDVEGAPVWVGSELSDDHSVRQRVLRSGDTVQILAEDVFRDTTGSTRVYKIAPPAREFRWVKGDFLVPRNESQQLEALSDPYLDPLAQATESESDSQELVGQSEPNVLQSTDRELILPQAGDVNDPRAALREIDHHYSEMIELDPLQWDIEELARSYEGLAEANPQLAVQIKQRLAALETRRKMHAEYRSFVQLSSETTLRDQQLAAQTDFSQTNVSPTDLAMEIELGNPTTLPSLIQEVSTESMQADAIPSGAPAIRPSQPTSVSPRLNGAGIVQRLPNGRFGILAPNGRLLAVLQADRTFRLDRVVGQSMGFIGERSFDRRIGTDLLVVKQMMPIQLER